MVLVVVSKLIVVFEHHLHLLNHVMRLLSGRLWLRFNFGLLVLVT